MKTALTITPKAFMAIVYRPLRGPVGRLFALALFCCAASVAWGQKTPPPAGMVRIPGGTFAMGANDDMPFEGPVHMVSVRPFFLDTNEVTISEFARFVRATGYKTEAEKFGWSGVFDTDLRQWTKGDGANWRHPDGPQKTPKQSEPVTQVSYADAQAYARWAQKRLPTEAEWEWAARGGLSRKTYAWGDELNPHNKPQANWWQGTFPDNNTRADGFLGPAPVGSFAPNGYGLSDMAGNVWEWCADWFDETYYKRSPKANPTGPETGTERVIRGGSWMCSLNYCRGFRAAARSHSAPDSGLNNLGFRCARDIGRAK
jgi:formylglycine-generating enzyme required for sulfatase activity